MGKREHWLRSFVDFSDLSQEVLPGESLIEIRNDSRFLIEHHKGIMQYGKNKIGIKVKYGHVFVRGEE